MWKHGLMLREKEEVQHRHQEVDAALPKRELKGSTASSRESWKHEELCSATDNQTPRSNSLKKAEAL
jgi:hypothetical protein